MVAAEPVPDENGEIEPSFDDSEYGYEDTIDDTELLGDILRKKPSASEYERCCVIVFGIPVVGEDRLPKLKNVLGKLFSRISQAYNDYYPMGSDGKTKGYCFIEWPTVEIAETATAVLDGYILDKSHTFSANAFEDLHKFTEPDPKWEPPKPTPFVPTGDLWSWLQDEKCYDQFAVHYEKETSTGDKKRGSIIAPHVGIYEFKKGQDPQLAPGNSERQEWTETIFKWSPYGTFLASVHSKGVCLWAGTGFDRFARFPHTGVIAIDFSPCETYLVTYAPPESRWADDTNALRVFDVQSGEMRRGFSLLHQQGDSGNQLPCWPYLQWSSDEKYVACPKPGGNGISVFETENFTLLDKKHVTIEGLRNFQWSPAHPIIAYYCEERTAESAPAEIGLLAIPSKQKLRAQRIFSVSEAELFWNKHGDRLAARTERYQKKIVKSVGGGEDIKYSKPSSHIEIFDAREKEVSVLSLLLSEPYVGFGWEPAGEKFCVLVGTQHKTTPLVYVLDASKHVPQLISKFEASERFSTVSWAPAGGWLVVYSAGSSSGGIMFIDTNGAEPTRTMLVEYPGFNKGYWDPTGRYFAAAYTIGGGRSSSDTGYRIFTFQGKELFRKNLDRMVQFKWRPRPPVKLPDETVRMIRKNLKATSARFEEEDKRERGRASQEVIEKRRKVMKEFSATRAQHKELYDSEAALRIQLRGGFDSSKVDSEDLVEETITVPLTTERVKIQEETIDEE